MVAAPAATDAVAAVSKPAVPSLLVGRSNTAAIWRVAWPSVAIGLLRTALGQIDAWYIGRIGPAALQGISAASFAVWMVYVAGELSSVGVHALSSAAEGAGDRSEGVGDAVVQGLWFSLATSALLAAVLTRPRVLATYFAGVGVTDPIAAKAGADYLRVTALGALPLSASACASAGFKGSACVPRARARMRPPARPPRFAAACCEPCCEPCYAPRHANTAGPKAIAAQR